VVVHDAFGRAGFFELIGVALMGERGRRLAVVTDVLPQRRLVALDAEVRQVDWTGKHEDRFIVILVRQKQRLATLSAVRAELPLVGGEPFVVVARVRLDGPRLQVVVHEIAFAQAVERQVAQRVVAGVTAGRVAAGRTEEALEETHRLSGGVRGFGSAGVVQTRHGHVGTGGVWQGSCSARTIHDQRTTTNENYPQWRQPSR
jgi:hypothetical protein